MSVKLRLTLISTSWLLLLLIILNSFIYTYFEKITTQMEVQLLVKKANTTVLQKENIHDTNQWQDPSLLSEFLIYNEMIRIIDIQGTIQNEIYTKQELQSIPAKFTSQTNTEIVRTDGHRSIVVRVPIVQNQAVIGTLEISKLLASLDYYGDILMRGLFIASGISILLSAVGGYLYTKLMFRPINELAGTMQAIEQSGGFRKLELSKGKHGPDELNKLGFIFNKMMGKLEGNFHRQRRFLADASHELRTPLTIIASYASLLKRWASNDPELREEAVEAIHSESIRLEGLVKSLLTLAEEEEVGLDLETFPLLPLIQSLISSLQQTYQRQFNLDIQPEDIEMVADMEKIKQLFIILLDNAIKYSEKEIEISIREEETFIYFVIQDYGIGIRQEKIAQLFERFYRVDQARNRKTGGAGLGLPIAKQIIEQHDGLINVDSELNVGTTIRVTFPKQGE